MPLLISFIRKARLGRGLLSDINPREKAGCSLEGGGRPLLEGSSYSERPCAEVLSTAGFFAVLEGFPGREGFISEGRKASFLREEPLLFGKTEITVIFSEL